MAHKYQSRPPRVGTREALEWPLNFLELPVTEYVEMPIDRTGGPLATEDVEHDD